MGESAKATEWYQGLSDYYPSPEEENQNRLVAKARDGDNTAFEELYNLYQPLIRSLAWRNAHYADPDDLKQDAVLVLHKAVRSFNPSFHTSFFSWVQPWMSSEMKRGPSQRRVIPFPYRQLRAKRAIFKVENRYYVSSGQDIPQEQLFEEVNAKRKNKFTRETLQRCLVTRHQSIFSLDVPYSKNRSMTLGDAISSDGDPYISAAANERQLMLHDALNILPERERYIVTSYFGMDCSHYQIDTRKTLCTLGREIGFCTERVRQIKEEALRILSLHSGLESYLSD